jgi:hypothetical protein
MYSKPRIAHFILQAIGHSPYVIRHWCINVEMQRKVYKMSQVFYETVYILGISGGFPNSALSWEARFKPAGNPPAAEPVCRPGMLVRGRTDTGLH